MRGVMLRSRAVIAAGALLFVLGSVGCGGQPAPRAAKTATATPATRVARATPSAVASPRDAPGAGTAGAFRVGERQVTFTEQGRHGTRRLVTTIWYPAGVPGRLPLLLFAPGFLQCPAQYSDLLRSWARAGYVVAAVDFPRTDCRVGAAADEADMVNQPADMSYVLTRMLAKFPGMLDPHEVAAVGQSDGGDTVAALAANTCCADRRLAAVAVLSGAEWPPMPGRYFAGGAPPMLFTQGTADTINPPWTSMQLYKSDRSRQKYYLDLLGADHLTPYQGTNRFEQVVARVTLEFFDRYVLGQAGALDAMRRDASVAGVATLLR
jgi:dienelactone hydrolase